MSCVVVNAVIKGDVLYVCEMIKMKLLFVKSVTKEFKKVTKATLLKSMVATKELEMKLRMANALHAKLILSHEMLFNRVQHLYCTLSNFNTLLGYRSRLKCVGIATFATSREKVEFFLRHSGDNQAFKKTLLTSKIVLFNCVFTWIESYGAFSKCQFFPIWPIFIHKFSLSISRRQN